VHGASFRDPAGFVFRQGGVLYRQVNEAYLPHYRRLMSGLYQDLTSAGLLVEHEQMEVAGPTAQAALVLRPEAIRYVSYPYEWSFSQLRDAALLTLEIQQRALSHGQSLKDASAYNVQYVGARPIFIDTLSFEMLDAGKPWVAYRQFCQHFLAPLAVMAYTDVRTGNLLRHYLDGLPLDLACALLPARAWLRYSLLAHVRLHAASQRRAPEPGSASKPVMNLRMHQALVASLRRAVEKIPTPGDASVWGDYYDDTNYSAPAMAAKERIVGAWLAEAGRAAAMVVDLGANTGRFSALAANSGAYVVAHDLDEVAVDRHYRALAGEARILPLVLDLTNPSPAGGWHGMERSSFFERSRADVVLALALVHHLAIGNNLPLMHIVNFLADLSTTLIVEFVPREDSQVQRMLETREDIFGDYTRESFEKALGQRFEAIEHAPVADSQRVLYRARARTC
jgi:SAM-dependent methyltransferase